MRGRSLVCSALLGLHTRLCRLQVKRKGSSCRGSGDDSKNELAEPPLNISTVNVTLNYDVEETLTLTCLCLCAHISVEIILVGMHMQMEYLFKSLKPCLKT